MAFGDEAGKLGAELLSLIPGNLRDKSRFFRDRHGISIPYSSYSNQWRSLVGQIGIVDAARKTLEEAIANLQPRAESALRRSEREAITQKEIDALDLWAVVDYETGRANELGSFVLKYGGTISLTSGRLSAMLVYHISACINWLLQSRPGDQIVFQDGAVEKHGERLILAYLRNLEQLLGTARLAPLEQERLHGLVDTFEVTYCREYAPPLSEEDHLRMSRVLAKIEATVTQEVTNRDFAELTPVTGVLDYRKLPSELLDSLLASAGLSGPNLVRRDLEEAVNCLRFGAPTASVMVGLRAVEGFLREFYNVLTGEKTRRGWADLLKEIRQVLADKGLTNAPVMGYLDYIRDVRNTADHPDTTFNQIEAEQALIQATNAIRELDKLKSTSAKTSNQ